MPKGLNSVKISVSLLLLLSSVVGFAQKDSPWKKLTEQTVSNVFMGLGRHQYSLDDGQGFSVYLKNYSTDAVIVTGKLVAKTTCGGEVTTNFSTQLAPNQESSGGNFGDSANSQTGVVSKENCAGKRVYLAAKKFVVNRIQEVYLKDINVQPFKGEIKKEMNAVQQAIPAVPKVPVINWDSIRNARIKDSLQYRIDTLEKQNWQLQKALQTRPVGMSREDSLAKIAASHFYPKNAFLFTPYGGVGWEQLPININQDSVSPSTFTGASQHLFVTVGATLGFFNQSPISLQVNPFVSYGLNFGSGVTGHHVTFGALATLFAGETFEAPLKAFIEGGFIGRDGSWSQNINVPNPIPGQNAINTNQAASYNYNVLRYGLGMQYQWKKGKSFIKPGVYWDKPSMDNVSTGLVEEIKAQLNGKWVISVTYGNNYIPGGTIHHYNAYTNNSQNYLNIKVLVNLKTFMTNL